MNPALLPVALIVGILGLAIGSFLNVVIHRVPLGQSVVSPGSHCPRCTTPIKGRHNVPVVGWLVLRGRCASCALPISARYPVVEAVTGILFAAVTLRLGLSADLPAFLLLGAVGVTLAMIDVDVHRLPDAIVLPSYVAALALLLPAGAVGGDWHPVARGVVGGVTAAALAFTVALVLPHRVSFDDAKLAGLLGLYVGWLSWAALLLVVLVAAVVVAAATAGRGRSLTTTTLDTRADSRLTARPAVASLSVAPCLVAVTLSAVFLAVPLASWSASLLTG